MNSVKINLKKQRPSVSFILISYNQEEFIREALEGAFAQTYRPLEIILSDDCSQDETFRIMQEMTEEYDGFHQIKLNRNETNLGLAGNVNQAISLASGEILVLAGGDDISMPERVAKSVDILESNPNLTSVSFQTVKFKLSNELSPITLTSSLNVDVYSLNDFIRDSTLHTNGAARAMRRRVVDYFGKLQPNSPTEDSTYLLRSLLIGNVAQVMQPQVYYRIHGNNLFASDNKYNFDYQSIHTQYLSDIELAVKSQDISVKNKTELIKSLNVKLARNLLRNEFHFSPNKKVFFISRIFYNKNLSVKQKIKYLRMAFFES